MRGVAVAVVCIALTFAGQWVSAVEPSTYRVGAAVEVITPKLAADAPPIWLAGYGPGRQAEKIHDDIYARAIVIHDGKFGIAIVALDLVGFFNDEVVRIRKQVADLKLDPPIDYVLVSSTHTHASADTVGIWGPIGRTGIIPGHLKMIREKAVEAIRKAHESAKMAKLRIAQFDANEAVELIGDSRLPKVIDSRVTVIQAKEAGGKVIATWVNMPCHPEVLGSKNKELSSDFPSTEREYIEKLHGGVAIHNTGTIGGLLAPREPKIDPFTKKPLPEDQIGQMMVYGRIIAKMVDKALSKAQPLTGPVRASSKDFLVPVWNQVYKVAMGMGNFQRMIYNAEGKPVEIGPSSSAASQEAKDVIRNPFLHTEVGLIEIGPLQIAAIPGEIYPELTVGKFQRPQETHADFPGAPLEPTIFPLMKGKYKMVIGLANDEIGYIIPKSQWDWFAPYAYNRKERQYGEFNSVGPEVAPLVMAAWESLIKAAR